LGSNTSKLEFIKRESGLPALFFCIFTLTKIYLTFAKKYVYIIYKQNVKYKNKTIKNKKYMKKIMFYAVVVAIIACLINGSIVSAIIGTAILMIVSRKWLQETWIEYRKMRDYTQSSLANAIVGLQNNIEKLSTLIETMKEELSTLSDPQQKEDYEIRIIRLQKYCTILENCLSSSIELESVEKQFTDNTYLVYRQKDLLFHYSSKVDNSLQRLGKEMDENIKIIEKNLSMEAAK